jgi:hypothetical protein
MTKKTTHCRKGHLWTPYTTLMRTKHKDDGTSNTYRICRLCQDAKPARKVKRAVSPEVKAYRERRLEREMSRLDAEWWAASIAWRRIEIRARMDELLAECDRR